MRLKVISREPNNPDGSRDFGTIKLGWSRRQSKVRRSNELDVLMEMILNFMTGFGLEINDWNFACASAEINSILSKYPNLRLLKKEKAEAGK